MSIQPSLFRDLTDDQLDALEVLLLRVQGIGFVDIEAIVDEVKTLPADRLRQLLQPSLLPGVSRDDHRDRHDGRYADYAATIWTEEGPAANSPTHRPLETVQPTPKRSAGREQPFTSPSGKTSTTATEPAHGHAMAAERPASRFDRLVVLSDDGGAGRAGYEPFERPWIKQA